MHRLFNETTTKGVFPDNLKLADITPVFRKDYPFIVLPVISKIYQKLTQRQINN